MSTDFTRWLSLYILGLFVIAQSRSEVIMGINIVENKIKGGRRGE